MSATEELRRLLDERGVEYGFVHGYKIFNWDYDGANGIGSVSATEVDGGINIIAYGLTPEQAIAATLGDADLAAENAELREDLEFERSENGWAREFLNRMGQKCGTEDCPSLVAYVTKLESENAKLREQIHWLKQGDLLHVLTDQEYIGQCERERLMQVSIDTLDKENAELRMRITSLEAALEGMHLIREQDMAENAKLRELVRFAYATLAWADGATFSDGTPAVHACDRREVEDRMRELGIDADGGTMARLRFDRTAPRVIVTDGDTDCATGHCECGACGGAIDCWDRFCKHCGRELED